MRELGADEGCWRRLQAVGAAEEEGDGEGRRHGVHPRQVVHGAGREVAEDEAQPARGERGCAKVELELGYKSGSRKEGKRQPRCGKLSPAARSPRH